MKIKICGLTRMEDIDIVNDTLPDYIGFVFARNSRRYIDPKEAAKLRSFLDARIQAAGVFVDESLENIQEMVRQRLIDVVQLHGNETVELVEALKREEEITVVKAVSMTEKHWKNQLELWENSNVDYLLLDSGKGGTGETFDHQRIGEIKKPFFLAGGLTPENIEAAARQVNPFGLDISSGVETNGTKDREKIEHTIRRIRNVER